MRILHINGNYILSALHQTMIEHLNQVGEIENKVFVPAYDRNRAVLEVKDYAAVSECFKKQDRFFFYQKQQKIISAIVNQYHVADFDCIHAYTLFTDGNAAMQLSEKYHIPYVVAVRNTDLNTFFRHMVHLRPRGVKILKNAAAVFFLSPVYQKKILENYVPEELRQEIAAKSYVIPNGIDDFWHENAGTSGKLKKNQKTLRCIYVGNLDRNKNTELTLKAISALNQNGWNISLKAAGKIADRKVYEKLMKYPCFAYAGMKKKEELIACYREADIFIMPSHTETFGLVYAEAMSQGLPVIYTRGQGFDGQFPDGKVGYAVSDRNPYETARAIMKICRNYSRIEKNAVRCASKFRWDKICRQYYQIYHAVTGK